MRTKVKFGAFYRTFNGAVIGPMAINKDDQNSVYSFWGEVVSIQDDKGHDYQLTVGETEAYTNTGKYIYGMRNRHPRDLVEEVPNPNKAEPIYPTSEEIDAKDLLGTGKRKLKGPRDVERGDCNYPISEADNCGYLAQNGNAEAQDCIEQACILLGINSCVFETWEDAYAHLKAMKHPEDYEPQPLTVAIDQSQGDLVISRKIIDYIERCVSEIVRPTMNTMNMHNKAALYEDMVRRMGDMGHCISRALSTASLSPPIEPGFGRESPEVKAIHDECNRVGRINHGMRLAFNTLQRSNEVESDHG